MVGEEVPMPIRQLRVESQKKAVANTYTAINKLKNKKGFLFAGTRTHAQAVRT
jgi:hypothetical protein